MMNGSVIKVIAVSIAVPIILVAIAGYIISRLSPWPMILTRRFQEDRNAAFVNSSLERFVPSGVAAKRNLKYDPEDSNARLDVYYPAVAEGTDKTLPTIIWMHGGSWTTGSKDYLANYLKILASKGFSVVGVDYTLAPAKLYPTPLLQLNKALYFLQQRRAELHINPSRLFLAGDSAGAQIAAQFANIVTSAPYAAKVGIVPAVEPNQLRGVILHCGVYDAELVHYKRDGVLWAYFGTKDFETDPRFAQFSVAGQITAKFPATFVSAGNDDTLASQSYLFADNLAKQGVYVDRLFFPENYSPKVWHDFQFFLETEAARLALARTVAFIFGRLGSET
jgi:acetyl esterase